MHLDRTFAGTFFANLWRTLPRPIRRIVLTFFFFFVLLIMSGPAISLYFYVVDFYIPSMTIPVMRDLSKLPVYKDQITTFRPIVQPKSKNSFVLVLICSGASGENHVHRRLAIRKTWGKTTGLSTRVVFFLGKTRLPSVDMERVNEAKQYGDLLIGDFPDTYRNITKKLMMAFKWASTQNFKYLLKTDDDVYINMPSLINWLSRRPSALPLYAGVLYRANVIRDVKHKHYISWDDLPQKKYPWYPKGAMYVLSGNIVHKVVELSTKVKQITVDDAYIGIIVSYLGVQPIYLPGFIQRSFFPALLDYFDKCTYINIMGIADNLSPSDMYFVHNEVLIQKDSSKWMCFHVQYPTLTLVLIIMLVIIFFYVYTITFGRLKRVRT